MANQWFYAKDGQKYGPVTGKRLKELAMIGVVRRNDLIWSPGYSVWRPAKKFRGLLPKMDATSFNPAMSLFWRPGESAQSENAFEGLEPNSAATAVTPPLPRLNGAKSAADGTVATRVAPASTSRATPTRATVNRTNSNGRHRAAPAPSAAPSVTSVLRPHSARAVAEAAVAQPKAARSGFGLKGTLAIGGGIVLISLVYLVVLLQVL
jgi:hypothetical protein